MEHRKVIVVGVDGSPASRSALRWALAQTPSTVEAVLASTRVDAFVPATSMGVYPYAHKPEVEHDHPEQRLHDLVTEAVADVPGHRRSPRSSSWAIPARLSSKRPDGRTCW